MGLDAEQARDYLAGDEDSEKIHEQMRFAREQGVMGVPSFSIDGMFAVSGGQQPDTFLSIIDRLAERSGESASK